MKTIELNELAPWLSAVLESISKEIKIKTYYVTDFPLEARPAYACRVMYVDPTDGITLVINRTITDTMTDLDLMITLDHELTHGLQFKNERLQYKDGVFYWDGSREYWDSYQCRLNGVAGSELIALEIECLPWEQEAYTNTLMHVGLNAYKHDDVLYDAMCTLN